ncbi:MAG: N-acetylornithine carbamoyltransferase [Steroidobacteraceae bacterium]
MDANRMLKFLHLNQFERDAILDLVALATRLEAKPEPRALAGRILGLVFMNPSLRTLASMQAGMARLGGSSFVITPGQGSWQLETRLGTVMNGVAAEHIREGLPVLASYCDVLGIRSFADGKDLEADLADQKFRAMAELIDRPLINLESAISHPCQSLADWKTLEDLRIAPHARFVLSWVYHPRALPLAVPASTLHMAAMRGMDVVVLRPAGYELPRALMDAASAAARASGGSVSETDDRASAMRGAQVLYAKEWGAPSVYGNIEQEKALRGELLDWCVDESWFATAARDCKLMHCLPVRRNVAVADAVLDSARSVVLREAYNRLPAQMAVLHRLLSHSP